MKAPSGTPSPRAGNESTRPDGSVLKGKSLPGPAEAALNLIEDQERSGLVAGMTSRLEKSRLYRPDTRLSLYSLNDHRRRTFIDRRRQAIAITRIDKVDTWNEWLEGCPVLLLFCHREGAHRTSME